MMTNKRTNTQYSTRLPQPLSIQPAHNTSSSFSRMLMLTNSE